MSVRNETTDYKKIICLLLAIFFCLMAVRISEVSAFDYEFGNTNYGQQTVAQPAQWESYIDPITNITVRRITDIAVDLPGADGAHIDYVRKSPVSSDGRYLQIYVTGLNGNPYYILDLQNRTVRVAPHATGAAYANNGGLDAQPEYRWDLSGNHPTWIYYRDGMKFYRGDISYPSGQPDSSTANVLLHDFADEYPTGQIIYNDAEGGASADSRYWAFMVRIAQWDITPLAFITYDKDYNGGEGKIVGTYSNPGFRPNFMDVSPSGNRVYTENTSYDRDWSNPIQLVSASAHSGWAFDKNGNEGLVQINNAGTSDWLKFANSTTGASFTVINQADLGWAGHHFSRIYNPQHKGWIFMDTYTNDGWAADQILAIESVPANQNPRIWRIAYTQNSYSGGYSNPMVSMSKDGRHMYWGSNWRGTDNMEIYEATLPDNWWTDLNSGDSTPPPEPGDSTPPAAPFDLHIISP